MMERFLERISLSEYRDKFILKGGMLVAAMKKHGHYCKICGEYKANENFQAKVMHPTFVNPVLRYQQKSRLN